MREPRSRDAADKLPQRVGRVVGDEVAVDEHLVRSGGVTELVRAV